VKPAPDLFLRAAAALRIRASEILVIEDSANGLRAAHAAGMRCLLVPNEITRGQI
jgi:putative hydrolase of the HAD superfamily